MPKKSANAAKSRNWEADYDLPPDLDFNKLRVIGVGLDALSRHVADKPSIRTVALAADVAREFKTEEEVNEALRLVKQLREVGKGGKRRKSA